MFQKYVILIFLYVAFAAGHTFDPYPDLYEPNYLKRGKELNLFAEGNENFRLSDDAFPIYYTLFFNGDSNDDSFFGEVEIDFEVKKELQSVVLNQENLEILDQKLYRFDPEEDKPVEIVLRGCDVDDQYQKVECKLESETLQPGNIYRLALAYKGKVYNDMRGFYESYYHNENGEKVTIGTTHFGQQTRRLMPCFDEPKFKAQFQLNIGRNPDKHPISISNANLRNTEEYNETWVIDEYQPTSVISTYLLAFVISDFKEISDNDRDNHTFAIYARPNAIEQGSFAFGIGPKIIREFDKWNEIPYYEIEGVEKMDIAAIPDFSAGAMENWGLLLHREANLLVDDDHTNTQQKQRIALVISHEIAHMWFGDLVTCDWFDAIWLNEGFATYFEFIALDPVHEDWKVMDDFVVSTMHNALSADAQRSSHPLTNPGVNSYPEIRTLFSTITYDKGGSILRMMHNVMALNKFQQAIRAYLNERQYKTALPEHLFKHMNEADPTVEPYEIMRSYTEQPGYPLVSVKREGVTLKLTQKRFLIDEIDHNITLKWTIPITVAKSAGDLIDKRAHLTLFKDDEHEIVINGTSLDFYLLNIQQVGFYRVNYDQDNWRAIGRALKSENFGGIHVLNRAQIIDDLFNLARAGYLTYDFIFPIIDYVKHEKEYLPWYATLNGLSYLQNRIPDETYRKDFITYVNDLLTNIYDHLDFKSDDDHQNKLNRINILNWACKYGNEKCLEQAKKEFNNTIQNSERIDPDWIPAVYCTGVRGYDETWDKLWERFVTTNYATEQTMILTALGCTMNNMEINKFLDKILTDEIRPQDKSAAFNRAYSGNLENVDYVFDYITKNHVAWSKVMDLASTLGDLASRFTREDQIKALEDFVNTEELSEQVKERLKAAIERSNKNIEWDQKRLVEVKKFFKDTYGGSGTSIALNLVIPILSAMIFIIFNQLQ